MKELKNYTFRIRWSDEDSKWMGQCPAFMSLFSLHDDPAEALKEIMEKVNSFLSRTGEAPEEKSIFKSMDEMLSGAPGPFGKYK